MKRILLLIVLLNTFCFHSQSFTNGSVYDYNVGDTIVTSVTQFTDASISSYGPPTTTYKVFTGKQSTGSAIHYTVHQVVTTPAACQTCSSSISATNYNFSVTNLTASAISFSLGSDGCQKQVDTSYINSCGLHEHYKALAIANMSLCFEPPTLEYKIIEGIGIFEFTLSLNGFPTPGGFKEELLWFRKGNQRCGSATAIPDGIMEWTTVNNKLKLFPNPSNGTFIVDVYKEGILSAENISGNEVYMSMIQQGKSQIDLSYLPAGIYFIKCRNEDGVYRTRIVLER